MDFMKASGYVLHTLGGDDDEGVCSVLQCVAVCCSDLQ